MPRIDKYLALAVSERASDVHFSSEEPTRMRVDGDLVSIDEKPWSNESLKGMLFEILNQDEQEKLITTKNFDKSYVVNGTGFFRVNMYWTRRGISAVLRAIPYKIPSFGDLGAPEILKKLADSPKGLILVTGPTGSGKSTTLAAMINHINETFSYHILTAEDPVEFVHKSKKSLVNQREIGASCPSFSEALKYALREDPDVILVGEMRDLETIGLALTAAETGHLVFGTLHTRGAVGSIDRIIDSFPANQQAMIRTMLSESLVAVVSQSLLKRANGKGRVAAYEILLINHATSNLIREAKIYQIPSIMQTGRKEGMVLMDQYILDLVGKGIVTAEEALPYLENEALLAGKVKPSAKGEAATEAVPEVRKISGPEVSREESSAEVREAPVIKKVQSLSFSEPAPSSVSEEIEAVELPPENSISEFSENSDSGLLDFNEPPTDSADSKEIEDPPLSSFLDDFSENSRLEREESISEPVNKVVPLPTPNLGTTPKAPVTKPPTPQVKPPPVQQPGNMPPSISTQSNKPKTLPPPPPLKRKVG